MTTTAFCTMLRVTSLGRLIRSAEASCRLHEMPNRVVPEGTVLSDVELGSGFLNW